MSPPVFDSKFDKGVSLLCWAYNEEECLPEFLARATALMDATVEDYEIILIEDGSTDRTYALAEEFRLKKNPRLRIFRNERNLHIGVSSRRAFEKATKEYLFWQSIDWSYDVSRLREYLEYLKTYDIVQGVRRIPAAHRSDNAWKAFISIGNFLFIRMLFGVPLSDFQNVSFYPTRWIQSIRFEARSTFVSPEALLKSYWNGKSIKEVPIAFSPRKRGKAKGTTCKAIRAALWDTCRLWFKWIVLGQRGHIHRGKVVR